MSLITAQTAREYAARSLQSRLVNLAAKRERMNRPAPSPLADRIERTEQQLDELDQEIDRAHSGKDKLNLIRAKAELLKVWQTLTGFPSPGTRKSRGNSGATALPVPVPASPNPLNQSKS